MKNLFILIASVFIITSCKKDYVCNCRITVNGTRATRTQSTGFPPFLPASDTTSYEPLTSSNTQKLSYHKVSKNTMRGNCFTHSEESLNQTSTSNTAGIYTITTSDSGYKIYDCTIE